MLRRSQPFEGNDFSHDRVLLLLVLLAPADQGTKRFLSCFFIRGVEFRAISPRLMQIGQRDGAVRGLLHFAGLEPLQSVTQGSRKT
ncbi:hypothetical protein D7M15_18335 [Streptomyces sp. Z26]|nr:hypothetical protein D7M15_18335 [Streptomyces sp. Z26]